jgi:hypothetical protein
MNQRDRTNLEFLLNIGAGLARWFEQASDDDVAYAKELLEQYEQELDLEASELLAEEYGVNFVPSSSQALQ